MKTAYIILLSSLFLGCTQLSDPKMPVRPSEIPTETCDGTPIEWTEKKQIAYNEGRLSLAKDSTGCVIALVIKIR